ncbi:PQQ-dependent sugar dehydrogenase [Pedobacter foliorum]|uniref:PQQ-dependent sugar dehydrogenase n=1 Tax=Pedobacter foliorum TaxID=2739058 RepID=UPI00156404F4|nr:PQQ-dependent sugar dehydrogenase [Pedobacter foliorum]NRF38167.1 PQQ-dependent sugar dehydrogenase [Pedobacter foliorum]
MQKNRLLLTFISLFGLISSAFIDGSFPVALPEEGYQIDTVAENLRVPWQIVFLPDKSILFTEREGRVRIIRNNKLVTKPIFNLNDVVLRNKSGALGLCLHPSFSKNKQIYLASNYLSDNRMKLRIVRYELIKDTLLNPLVILKDIPANQNHTGCRLVFGPDKKLYITTGDADQPMLAQDLKAYNGKILRVNDDGGIPTDNPFVKNDTARKEIWSFGHRNPQGIAFQPVTGLLYESEHGPTGGDEINLIKKGGNYGWPGIHHDDKRDGMESPLVQYTPSIGPSEILFYNGVQFPQLTGKLLVACLRGEAILNLSLVNNKITDQLVMIKNKYGRIRSLVTGPDGYIYFSTSMNDPGEGHPRDGHDDMILRMRPSGTSVLESQKLSQTKTQAKQAQHTTAGIFQQLCASCHGNKLQGTPTAKGFINSKFLYGSDKKSIVASITNGITDKGMPAWNGAINTEDISKLADFILKKSKKKQ